MTKRQHAEEARAASANDYRQIEPEGLYVPEPSQFEPPPSTRPGFLEWFNPIPASELGNGEIEDIEWIWHGWLARGHFTLFSGFWKGGKTTLFSHLLAGTDKGCDIAGKVAPSRWLVMSEESRSIWDRRKRQLDIRDNCDFVCRPLRRKLNMAEWVELLERISHGPHDAVLFDTLSYWWPVLDENNAPEVQAALMPVAAVLEAGKAVKAAHHPKKGESGAGQSARGSGALSGYADVLAELKLFDPARHDDPKRKLRGLSRFDETPYETVIELCDDGYQTLGDVHVVDKLQQVKLVADILADATDPLAYDAIRAAWPAPKPSLATIQRLMRDGYANGNWVRTGTGKKGDPYCYSSL